jgi:hypothetical protein
VSAFTGAIARHLEGVDCFSVGGCHECEECSGSEEGHFSWSSCDSCGSSLGGDRFPAHGFVKLGSGKEVLTHFDVCVDCLLFHANGDEPEGWTSGSAPAGWAVAETLPAVSEMSGNQLRALREAREARDFADSPAGMVAGWIAEQREMGLWDGE